MFFESTVLLCSAPGILLSALSLLTGVYFFHTRSRGGCGGLRPPPSGYSTRTVHITKAVMVLAALSVFFLVFLGAFGDIELRRGLHSFLGKVEVVGDIFGSAADELGRAPVGGGVVVGDIVAEGRSTREAVREAVVEARNWNQWRMLLLLMGFLVPTAAGLAGMFAALGSSATVSKTAAAMGFAGLSLAWLAFAFHLPASVLLVQFCLSVAPHDMAVNGSALAGNGTLSGHTHLRPATVMGLSLLQMGGGAAGVSPGERFREAMRRERGEGLTGVQMALLDVGEEEAEGGDNSRQTMHPTPLIIPDADGTVVREPYEPVAIFLRCPPPSLFSVQFDRAKAYLISRIQLLNNDLVAGGYMGISLSRDLLLADPATVNRTLGDLSLSLHNTQATISGHPGILTTASPLIEGVQDAAKVVQLVSSLGSCKEPKKLFEAMRTELCSDTSTAVDAVTQSQAAVGLTLVVVTMAAILGMKRFRPEGAFYNIPRRRGDDPERDPLTARNRESLEW